MKFIDLFAGLGGFHIGLKKLGHTCVFASEIDPTLRKLYQENFKLDCSGDITKIDTKNIPAHDILCAGFPCQPFSKAGKQKGLEDTGRGDMIFEVVRILKDCKPGYFILENVPTLKTHDKGKTWEIIKKSLEDANYNIQDIKLSPHLFGVPHKRERIFILGKRKQLGNIENIKFDNGDAIKNLNMENFLLKIKNKKEDIKKISQKQIDCLNVWQEFIDSLPKDKPLPKFAIWSMEFGANYPLDRTPYYMRQKELEKYKGVFGQPLKGFSKEEQLKRLPIYSIYPQKQFPTWKKNYINKNRIFWQENKKHIEETLPKIKEFINSWQKLEWNAGDGERNIFKYLLQFRSSGIRVKNPSSISSLVLTNSQIPIISWEKRYLSLAEAQKLQGFEAIKMPQDKRQAFKALGNAVNTTVVIELVKEFEKTNIITQKK